MRYTRCGDFKNPPMDTEFSMVGDFSIPSLVMLISVLSQYWMYKFTRVGVGIKPTWLFIGQPTLDKLHFFQTGIFHEIQKISKLKPSKNWVGFLIFFPVSGNVTFTLAQTFCNYFCGIFLLF